MTERKGARDRAEELVCEGKSSEIISVFIVDYSSFRSIFHSRIFIEFG